MPERYKVLLVEDDHVDRMAFERFVRTEDLPYDYTIAGSVTAAHEVLASEPFDVVLMDYMLGDGTSLELFEAAQNMPIIVITGSSNLEIAVKIMKAGAYDFLVKDTEGNYLITLPIVLKNTIERWRAEQELKSYRNNLEKIIEERTKAWQEGELRLLAIVESTPIIVFSLDTDAKFTFVAGHTEDILWYSPHQMIGKALFELFPGSEAASRQFQEAVSGGKFASDVEINGHWLSINASAKWENGTITGVIGSVHDVTERKRADLAVVQERNLLRTLIDNIPDYIFIKDQEGRFVESNRAHAAGANLSRKEILNQTASEIFDPAVAEQFHADDLYVMTSGKSIINEERVTTGADASKRWVLTTKVPLFDESKQHIIGLVGISRDITERRKAEETRLQAERLRIEIEQERAVVDMKQRFIATASHDFRTPLSIIKMTASTLKEYYDRLTPEKRLEKLNQIQSQVDRMVSLLDDVLTLSKVSAGKADFSLRKLDLKAFCDRIWDDMVRVDQQQHQCQLEFLATLQEIMADEHLLQQILVNLLSNAFKYTPPGGNVQFHISNDDRLISLRVNDTGYGIPEADQKHLFEPFYRATNVKNIQGTGLGLMIVKAYVELHGGTITVDSKEGIGTTFTVQLPVHQ